MAVTRLLCRRCKKRFLAEVSAAGASVICYDCDVALRHLIETVLAKKRLRGS